MSDFGRKSMGDQLTDKVKPESEKSTTERIGDNVSQKYDHAAAAVQPNSQKSTSQQVGDNLRSTGDDAQSSGKGVVEQASDAVANAAQTVKDTIQGNNK